MRKKILSFLILLPAFILLFYASLAPISAQTNLGGLEESAQKVDAYKNQVSSYDTNFLQTKTGQIVGTVLSFVGVLFLLLMIYAGVTWMTAQGNEQQVTKAKNLLINATIGIIIVFAAYAITTFVGNEVLR